MIQTVTMYNTVNYNSNLFAFKSLVYDFRGGGPVQFIDELSTDFGSANCWNNVKTNNIKWQKATGAPDSKKVQYLFGTSTGPGNQSPARTIL